ncbi:MAG: hypothetical protein MHMPM18_005112, partial [Marteilia pararefringens]
RESGRFARFFDSPHTIAAAPIAPVYRRPLNCHILSTTDQLPHSIDDRSIAPFYRRPFNCPNSRPHVSFHIHLIIFPSLFPLLLHLFSFRVHFISI